MLPNMEKQKNKLIAMGGTFDPPTFAHRSILRSAMDLIQADLSIIVPSNDLYNKRSWQADYDPSLHQDFETRVKFLELTFPESCFFISQIEGESKRRMPMIKTLTRFHQEYPDHELYLLLGDDNLMQFHRWIEPQKILELANLIVIEREGNRSQIEEYRKKHRELNLSKLKIIESDPETRAFSSTRVRQCTSIVELDELVVPDVRDYILEHHLYQF